LPVPVRLWLGIQHTGSLPVPVQASERRALVQVCSEPLVLIASCAVFLAKCACFELLTRTRTGCECTFLSLSRPLSRGGQPTTSVRVPAGTRRASTAKSHALALAPPAALEAYLRASAPGPVEYCDCHPLPVPATSALADAIASALAGPGRRPAGRRASPLAWAADGPPFPRVTTATSTTVQLVIRSFCSRLVKQALET
jgi:hypothetical protein